jgi:L-ascorbate 6-phosphate lactonase
MSTLAKEIKNKRVPRSGLVFWWLGQEGFVFKTQNLILYIDPYLSTYAETLTAGKPDEHVRITPAPMQPNEVDHADLVLCTHDHADHIDVEGIPLIALASPDALFVVPECARQKVINLGVAEERIHSLKGDDNTNVKGIKIHGIPAKHEQFDKDPEKGFPYLSYLIKLEDYTIFHAGDTIPFKGQVERVFPHAVDIALLPINGRDAFRHSLGMEGNFTCEEAVGFGLAIKAGLTIPMHYDMFTLNTADVRGFIRIAEHRGLVYRIMKCGKALEFSLEGTP